MRVAVVGAGSWGTALARLAGERAEVRLWAREPEVVAAVRESRENTLFLPGYPLPATVTCTGDLAAALDGAEVVLMAVPSHGFRAVLRTAAPSLPPAAPVVSVTKVLGGIGISNSIVWSLDDREFYFADTLDGAIDRFDYDATLIVVQDGNLAQGETIKSVLGVGEIVDQPSEQDVADVIVIIGADYVPPAGDD